MSIMSASVRGILGTTWIGTVRWPGTGGETIRPQGKSSALYCERSVLSTGRVSLLMTLFIRYDDMA